MLAEAAVEGLAKIGAPAVAAPEAREGQGQPVQRLYAYAGFGWIEGDTAYGTLVDGLARDQELIDVLRGGIAHSHRPAPKDDAAVRRVRRCER